jgi:hypothetical protein
MEYNSEVKFNLICELAKKIYFFQFKKWQCIQHKDVSGKRLKLNTTNIYRNVTNPVWVFVVFQIDRVNDKLNDNSIFDRVNVKNLWMEIGGRRYPKESWDLDLENNYNVLVMKLSKFSKEITLKRIPFHMLIKVL